MARRSFYFDDVSNFLCETESSILGKLADDNTFAVEDKQWNTWKSEITLLKEVLDRDEFKTAKVIFEYTIPRVGSRVDVAILINACVILLEFKVGGNNYFRVDLDQVAGYRDDIYDFHEYSWQNHVRVFPMLVVESAPTVLNCLLFSKNMEPLRANFNSLEDTLLSIISGSLVSTNAEWQKKWHDSIYHPTPTIIEAAEYMYKNHTVEDISRNDATAKNLDRTYNCVAEIIEDSKRNNKKSICFITGVPGAGKTLAGLHIAIERRNVDNGEHAIFLSGNQPLVTVLQEALARNAVKNQDISKLEAKRETKSFIQIIHHFRDEMIESNQAPIEHVSVFDESQRAWTKEQLSSFMKTKKNIADYDYSEPQFLIEAMDRHKDWAVIVCLVGGGQEINKGEAGIYEWFSSLEEHFPNWQVYVSTDIQDYEYTGGKSIKDILPKANERKDLHLSVPLRSYRSPRVADFIKEVIDGNCVKAKLIYEKIDNYPIYITRSLTKAKKWAKNQVGKFGKKRAGLIASSNAIRLQPEGVFVKNGISVKSWFLDGREDIRSSYAMETAATEFDIQGLEIDFAVVCWDLNFRVASSEGERYRKFTGTKWNKVNKEVDQRYIKNSYRVLLTRAREGFVIYIPYGDESGDDMTRPVDEYNKIYNYLVACGIQEL